jgi:hypothetical protein
MNGRGFRHKPGDYNHKDTSEKVVGEGTAPGARIPANLNVRPLKGPPMVPIKDADPRCTCADMDGFEDCPVHV